MAWEEQQPSQFLHDDSYRKILPHYVKQVESYAVSSRTNPAKLLN